MNTSLIIIVQVNYRMPSLNMTAEEQPSHPPPPLFNGNKQDNLVVKELLMLSLLLEPVRESWSVNGTHMHCVYSLCLVTAIKKQSTDTESRSTNVHAQMVTATNRTEPTH